MGARDREPDDRREAAEEAAPAPPVQAAARPASAVLSLQRSAGNRAVTAMLSAGPASVARNGPVDAGVPPIAGVPPNAQMRYDEAIAGRDWNGAATALGEMSEQERTHVIGTMTTVQLVRVARAAESAGSQDLRDALAAKMLEPQHSAAVPTAELEEDLDRALAASDWRACVVALHGLPATTRTQRLERLTLQQLTDMSIGSFFMAPEYAPTRALVEARRVVQLGLDYAAALAANNFTQVVRLLNAYNDADLEAKIRALTPVQLPVLEGVALGMSFVVGDRVYRTIRFVQNGPGTIPAHAPTYTVTTPGTEAHHGAVGGGDVRVRTGTQATFGDGSTSPEAYEIEYSGPDSGTTQWLQFIWREVDVEEDWWPDSTLDDEISTTGGTYSLTTDRSKPNYNTDSAPGSATPFYESGGANLRGPTTTTMLDEPSAMEHLVKREFNKGADKVTSRAHFSTYLVRGMQVLYRVDLTVQWVFDRDTHYNEDTKALTTPKRTQTVDNGRAVSGLDPRMRKRLVAQWPAFNYIP